MTMMKMKNLLIANNKPMIKQEIIRVTIHNCSLMNLAPGGRSLLIVPNQVGVS